MKHFSQWDEYQWENEIRRHENNVACFFQDLVYCLDLPIGDVLFDPLASPAAETNTDPVSAKRSNALRQWMSEHGEFEDGEDDDYQSSDAEPRHPVCFSCVDALDAMAVQWNQFAATIEKENIFEFALGINCAFGKLLARTADFTEPGEECTTPLLITLGKRAINDLEDLVDRLKECSSVFPGNMIFSDLVARLAVVRDQLTAQLHTLRTAANR
ncbi:MAG: hypothetical protein E7053_03085 [Lentisphaerae bacterium]|nr:hypothetical protein [Lentisphaerota bacterium]